MKKNYFLIIFILISIFISSCKTDEPEEAFGIRDDKEWADYTKIATNQSPYNTTEHPNFSSVIMFSYSLDGSENQDYIASGVLINENWILTAGHNFYVASEQDEPAPVSGIRVLVGNDPNNPSAEYDVEELFFHPTWIEMNEDFLNANDLCLVKLSTPITNITPAILNFEETETIGATHWYCGFGDYSQQDGHNPDLLSEKHAIENVLDRKVTGILTSINNQNYYGGLLAFDFDKPDGSINSLGDNVLNSDEQILGTGTSSNFCTNFEGATVQGDSGGPIFMKIDGIWKVCGILSGGVSEVFENHIDCDYGDISIFIRVSSHKDWINSVIN